MKGNKLDFFRIYTGMQIKLNRALLDFGMSFLAHDKLSKNVIVTKDIPYVKNANQFRMFDCFNIKNSTILSPTVFFIHGGSWSTADKSYYTMFCKNVCEKGFTVININYTLMPDVKLDACFNDCVCAINYALSENKKFLINPKKIFIMGDSAGAHLASLIAAKLTNKSIKFETPYKILGTALYYGAYDLQFLKQAKGVPLKYYDKYFEKIYKNKKEEFYYDFSASNFITKKFPATFITSGEVDRLHSQSMQFIDLLEQKNVPVTKILYDKSRKDGRHAFLNFYRSKAAKESFKALIEFFNSKL